MPTGLISEVFNRPAWADLRSFEWPVRLNSGKPSSWKPELQQTALRYHLTGSWIAAVLNLLFIFNDLLLIPEHTERFLFFRLAVSLCILLAIAIRRHINPQQLVLVPFALISIENAYMWSFMEPELFRTHSLAYAVLFVGAAVIVLWPLRYSLFVLATSLIANYFFLLQSEMDINTIMVNGGTLVSSIAIISVFIIQRRYVLAKREIVLRLRLKASTDRVQAQKAIIEENHKALTSSIRYSQRIQEAMMPSSELIAECMSDSFIFFRPKDIVSGDFYWCRKEGEKVFVAAVDCTGHGVPGALMSMLGSALLNKIVVDEGEDDPARILGRLRAEVIEALKQNKDSGSHDGMDMALCVLDERDRTMKFAGAFNPMFLVRKGELLETKADRMPIGMYDQKHKAGFTAHQVELRSGDMIYLFSDGYADQFGGPKDRKFGKRRFKELLVSISNESMTAQRKKLAAALHAWQGGTDSVDDVLVIGFRFN